MAPDESEKALAQHIITLAVESDDLHMSVDSDLDVNLYDWSIEELDRGSDDEGQYIEVHARQGFKESVRASQGSRHHPPEYKNFDGTLYGRFRLYPALNDGFGISEGEIMQEGGKPSPPDPDPYDL